jgi:hypothetical protein
MQKLALQASGANAVALGGLGMMSGIPPGLMASMLPGMGNGLSNPLETITKVVALTQVVSADELKEDEEYEEILEDMREECGKYGTSFRLTFILAYKNNSHQWCRNLAIRSFAIDDQVRCTQGNAVHVAATSAYIVQKMAVAV